MNRPPDSIPATAGAAGTIHDGAIAQCFPPEVEAGPNQVVDEGTLLNIVASFTDPSEFETHTAVIDWGDDSATAGTVDQDLHAVSGSHTYLDEGEGLFTATVTVTDSLGLSGFDTFTVTVNNVAPAVNAGSDQRLIGRPQRILGEFPFLELEPATFTDAGVLDTHTAFISWGDGTGEPGVVNESEGSGTVSGSHVYRRTGRFVVTVRVTDNDGATGRDSFEVTVSERVASFSQGGKTSNLAEGGDDEGVPDIAPFEPTAGPNESEMSAPKAAGAITDRTAIPTPFTNVEFDEVGLVPFAGTRVTTQFAALGVTFSDIINGVGGFTFTPESGFPGINDSNLGNFGGGVTCPGLRSIFFSSPVTAAGFNIVTNPPDSAKLTAKRAGIELETHVFNVSLDAVYFIGISNLGGFDELVLEIVPDADSSGANRCMLLDKLIFSGARVVSIDVLPGISSNVVLPGSPGFLPVAVLSGPEFNAASIDPSTVAFGPEGAPVARRSGLVDVNGDGLRDMVFTFRTFLTGIRCGQTEASLTGLTKEGQRFIGADQIVTAGCGLFRLPVAASSAASSGSDGESSSGGSQGGTDQPTTLPVEEIFESIGTGPGGSGEEEFAPPERDIWSGDAWSSEGPRRPLGREGPGRSR